MTIKKKIDSNFNKKGEKILIVVFVLIIQII